MTLIAASGLVPDRFNDLAAELEMLLGVEVSPGLLEKNSDGLQQSGV